MKGLEARGTYATPSPAPYSCPKLYHPGSVAPMDSRFGLVMHSVQHRGGYQTAPLSSSWFSLATQAAVQAAHRPSCSWLLVVIVGRKDATQQVTAPA